MARRRGALFTLGLAVVLLAGACRGERPTVGRTPVPGGALRVAVRDLGSLDPAATTGRGALLVIAQLFDSLTAVDPETGGVAPAAASSWDAGADGLTWTFHLRPATFHDGSPVAAGHFKAAFDRIVPKAANSDAAFQFESVKGFRAAKVAGTARALEGVTAPDAATLRIALERPFAELPLFLAHPALGPLAARAFTASPQAFASAPVGNGPFRMAGARAADAVVLERFDGHAGGTALLDRLEVRLVSDAEQGWRDYLAGRTDVAEVPPTAFRSGRGRFGRGGFTPFWGAFYYGLNLRLPKFAKPEVRRALSLALDREAIAQTVYGGTKEPATGIIPRGVRGYRRNACAECAQDVDRAGSLITAAFGAAPPEMVVDHLDASPSREVASAVVAQLGAVGLKAARRAHSSTEYQKFLQSGKQEIAELGWLAEVPSPDGFLAQQLRSGSPNNPTGFQDRVFDQLIDQARAAADETARIEAYRKAEDRAFEAMPLIPLVFVRNHVAVAERVRGLRIDGAGLFDAAAVWIAPP